MNETTGEPARKTIFLYLILLVVVLLTVAVRIRLLNVPLERDEGEYAYMGQLLLKGIPPFANAYTLKFPGVSIVYAAFMSLFGQSPMGIHSGLMVTNLISAVFLWMLTRRMFRAGTATCAAAIFLILSLSQGVLGVFAHATHYVALFVLMGAIMLLKFLEEGRHLLLAGSGFTFGAAIMMKQHGATFLIFALLYLLWKGAKDGAPMKRQLLSGTIFLVSAAAPLAFVFLWLADAGVFSHFWFWTVEYARDYTALTPLSAATSAFLTQLEIVATPQLLLWIAAMLGAALLVVRERARGCRVFVFGFLFAALLAICPGFYFREHYFVMALPAVAILAGFAVTELASIASGTAGRLRPHLQIIVLIALVACGLYRERLFLFAMSPVEVCRSTYGVNPFPESLAIARYIQAHTRPRDRVAVLGSEPEIYFYADRLSATGHLYLFPLMENQPHAVSMQEEMIQEIEAAHPEYIVMLSDVYWDMKEQSSLKLRRWADYYLARNRYQLAGVTNIYQDASVYYWNESVAQRAPDSRLYIAIWKRGTS